MWKFALVASLAAILTLVGGSAFGPRPGFQHPKIDAYLQEQLSQAKGPLAVDIMITLQAGTESVLTCMQMTTFTTRIAKLNRLRSSLTRHIQYTQAPVTKYLDSKSVPYTSFWISNQILVRDASDELILELAEFDQIREIQSDGARGLVYEEVVSEIGEPSNTILAEWGIEDIHAPEAWSMGANGTGAVVAVIATGARATHEALAGNFMGTYGWFDPYEGTSMPADVNGVGTHALGVLVGAGGIGVAPGAIWQACKGCDTVSCSQSALVACGQWVACPTLPDGSEPDCSKAANVVVSPWGAAGGQTFYNSVLRAWQAVDIVAVFGVGASGGTECGTVGSPGDSKHVLGVGAYSEQHTVNSGFGPAPGGEIKPDIVGPGSNVRSASHTSDTGYVVLSGSVNGGPHAGGVVALLQGLRPELGWNTAGIIEALHSSADPVTPQGQTCGGIPDTVYPNNVAGYGKLNAARAVTDAMREMSD